MRWAWLAGLAIGLSAAAVAQTGDETTDQPEDAVDATAPRLTADSFNQYGQATLRALDKITGRSTDFEMLVGEPKVYGSLRIDLQTCFQTPPEEPPESAAFLRVTSAASIQVQTMAEPRDLTEEELQASDDEETEVRFSGWMFASSPGLNALEHPVYDLWVIACSEVDPSELEPLDPNE